MQQELADLPYLPGEDARDILDQDGDDEGPLVCRLEAAQGSEDQAGSRCEGQRLAVSYQRSAMS